RQAHLLRNRRAVEHERVVAGVTGDEVTAFARVPREAVAPGPEERGVVAEATDVDVVATAGVDRVVARAGVDGVAPVAAEDQVVAASGGGGAGAATGVGGNRLVGGGDVPPERGVCPLGG